MSKIILTEQSSTPSTPTSGKTGVYVGTDAIIRSIDDAGAVTKYQANDADLDAIAALSSTGILARTGSGTYSVRTITAGTGMSIADGNGVSGNPTVTLANTAVSANTYGSSTLVPVITIDAQGRITAASTSAISAGTFGSEFYQYSSDAESSTTSTSFQNKLTGSPSLTSGRTYRINFFCNTAASGSSNSTEVKFNINSEAWWYGVEEPVSGNDQTHHSGFYYYTPGSSGTKNFTVEYRRTYSSGTAYISDARIEIWRVS